MAQLFNIENYPPHVSYFLDTDGRKIDVVDGANQALRVVQSSVGGQSDAFGRNRISQPYTLGDYKNLYAVDTNLISYATNGGTIAHQSNAAAVRLSTTGTSSSRIVSQSKMYHHYMPGKSQQILSSFNFYSPVANVNKRIGYYDDNNGIFLEQDGNGILSVNLRSYVGATVSTNRIVQSNWNIDPCDGTGQSKFSLDVTKTQLFFIDFQWLGVGRVRCGFVHDGLFITAHEFYNSNNLANVYMSNPNLPIRSEVSNGGTSSGGYMDQICASVISEGGYAESGQDWGLTSPSLRALAGNSTLPILAIRLQNSFKGQLNRSIVRMNSVKLFSSSENIKYKLIKLPDSTQIAGATWASIDSDSVIEYSSNATSYTDGDEIDNGWVTATNNGVNLSSGAPASNLPSTAKKNFIVQNYGSTDSEIYVIVATNLSANTTNVGAAIQWREIY